MLKLSIYGNVLSNKFKLLNTYNYTCEVYRRRV